MLGYRVVVHRERDGERGQPLAWWYADGLEWLEALVAKGVAKRHVGELGQGFPSRYWLSAGPLLRELRKGLHTKSGHLLLSPECEFAAPLVNFVGLLDVERIRSLSADECIFINAWDQD